MTPPSQQLIDPDSDRSRMIRAFNQFDGEPGLFSMSTDTAPQDRLIRIRELIFRKLSNVWGRDPKEIIAGDSVTDWPDKRLVREILWPAFELLMIKSDNIVTTTPDAEKETAALRLSVLAYFFGILLHPSIDGNGQSFRLLALTYLRKHSTRFSHALLPIKYVQDYGTSLGIHPITERMNTELLRITGTKSPAAEGELKESIAATLLTTAKGDAFCHTYLRGAALPTTGFSDNYIQSSAVFTNALASLERDFKSLIEKETASIHEKKHAAVIQSLLHLHISLDDEFTLSEEEREKIATALQNA